MDTVQIINPSLAPVKVFTQNRQRVAVGTAPRNAWVTSDRKIAIDYTTSRALLPLAGGFRAILETRGGDVALSITSDSVPTFIEYQALEGSDWVDSPGSIEVRGPVAREFTITKKSRAVIEGSHDVWVRAPAGADIRITLQTIALQGKPVAAGNSWSDPVPHLVIPPNDRASVVIVDSRRLLLEAVEPVDLQVTNPSIGHDVQLMTKKGPEFTHVAFVHRGGGSSGSLSLTKAIAGIVEMKAA